LFVTFITFANVASPTHPTFKVTPAQMKEHKNVAKVMGDWMSGPDGRQATTVYMQPYGVATPKIIGRLDEKYVVESLEDIEGEFTVVGQIDALLGVSQKESIIRVLRGTPATPSETEVILEAMKQFAKSGAELGVEVDDDDIQFTSPTVILRPIAIYR
jgi:hypothetical protein